MKVLIFSPYYPPHIGGLETHSDEFNKYLSMAGVEITVFTPQLPKDAPSEETRYNNVKVFRFPAFELIHNYPFPKFWSDLFWKQWKVLLQNDYHLVICRTRFFFTSLMAWYYTRRKKLSLVHIEHGSDYAQFNGYCKTKLGILYDKIFGRFVIRHANIAIANSNASAHFVHKLSKRTDCHVIYRGIETALLEAAIPDTALRATYPNKMIIGYIGRLIDGKGVADLIYALANIKRDDFICLIIGEGPEKPKLEKIVSDYNLSQKVLFLDQQPFSKAMGFLKIFDISINPSYTEGIPTSVVEAAFYSKAIIATDVGGTREIISGNKDGFLIKPGDINSLIEKIDLLLSDPTLRKLLGKNAYQKVSGRFLWSHSTEQYLKIFQKLLQTTSAH